MKRIFQKEPKRFRDATRGMFLFLFSADHAVFHGIAAAIALLAAWYFHISATEWMLIILCIGFVFCAEAINESIERMADFVHKAHHPDIGKIKDIAAGAVLIAAITSAVIGMVVFLPKILDKLN